MSLAPAADGASLESPSLSPLTETSAPVRVGAGVMGLFSAPAIPFAALSLPMTVYLPPFYARHIGISLAMVGLIFTAVRLADIMLDPALGYLMDRTRTRWGRFRPWMSASVPVVMLASYLAFMARPGATPLYLSAVLVLLFAGYSMGVVAHLSWAAVMAKGYHARSRVYGWLQALTVGGMVLVLLLPPIATRLFPANEAAGVQSMGWFIIVLAPLTVLLAVWRVREPAAPAALEGEKSAGGLLDYGRLAWRPVLARLLICGVLLALAPGITGALFVFFFGVRGFSVEQSTLLLLIYFVGGLAGAPIWTKLAKRFGKHRTLMISCAYYAALQGSTLLVPRGSMAWGAPSLFLAGIGFSAALILLRAMVADVCDEARLDMKVDCTGMIYALYTSTTKISAAVAVGITYPLLQWIGFVAKAGARNSAGAVQGLEWVFVIFPVFFVVVGGLSLIGYSLDERRHGEIRAALDVRDALNA
jgi:Na+/melibiose symporter-like transporter